jgi:LmbE family N-acetylglucosaminyl deacetylase
VLPVTPVCDPGRVPVLNSAACPSLTAVAPLRLGRVRTVVALAAHSGEELCAAGGLLASLAAAGARVRVLVVTDEISDPDRAPVPVGQRRVRLASAYQLLGLDPASRYRLGLHRVTGAAGEADVLGAISELLGFADPKGLLCVAPWIQDTHPDHDAVGRAATAAAHAYHARLLYYSITAWGHPGSPAQSDVPVLPLRQARRFALPQALDTRKYQALAHLGRPPLGAPASTPTPPAPGAQACEVFIT